MPGNCTASKANADGMISKAAGFATAVKASSNKNARLSLGVEVSCFSRSDAADYKYQYKLSFCETSPAYLAEQMKLTEELEGILGVGTQF